MLPYCSLYHWVPCLSLGPETAHHHPPVILSFPTQGQSSTLHHTRAFLWVAVISYSRLHQARIPNSTLGVCTYSSLLTAYFRRLVVRIAFSLFAFQGRSLQSNVSIVQPVISQRCAQLRLLAHRRADSHRLLFIAILQQNRCLFDPCPIEACLPLL